MRQRFILIAASILLFVPSLAIAQCSPGCYGQGAPSYYSAGGYPATAYSAPQLGRPQYPQSAYASPGYYPVMNQISSRRYAAYPYQSFRPVYPVASPQGPFVGQGILGQVKAYVPGQPLRNFLRYITP